MFCPKCGAQYEGNYCPNGCNSPYQPPKKKRLPTWGLVLIIVGAVVVFAVCMGLIFGERPESESGSSSVSSAEGSSETSGSEPSSSEPADSQNESSQPEQEVVQVTALELFADYDANEVAAEQKYDGKLLEITGTVKDISRDVFDDLYVTLEAEDNEYSFYSVQCYINENDEASMEKAAALVEGDTAVIRGYVGSFTLNLSVKECTIQ